jgi:hypothetical protein
MAILAYGYSAEHGDVEPHWIDADEAKRDLLRRMHERTEALLMQRESVVVAVDATMAGATDLVRQGIAWP